MRKRLHERSDSNNSDKFGQRRKEEKQWAVNLHFNLKHLGSTTKVFCVEFLEYIIVIYYYALQIAVFLLVNERIQSHLKMKHCTATSY